MADRVMPGPLEASTRIKEAVSVNVRKIFDGCRDKDCVEDLRLYPTASSQAYIDAACSVRPRSAELIGVDINVDEITFNRGYYTVDCKFFYKVQGVTFPGGQDISGLCVFDKRVILYGGEAGAKVFSSGGCTCPNSTGNSLPLAVCEAVDPITLNLKLVDSACVEYSCGNGTLKEVTTCSGDVFIPECVRNAFAEEISLKQAERQVFATLGQFSIIRLERETALVIPSYDYSIPDKSGINDGEEDPCTLFSGIPFPVEEFFPPNQCGCGTPSGYRDALNSVC